MQFGTIRKLKLRDIWPREATDFTPWLAENISELGEALGMDLEIKQTEAAVGEFSLDLLAVDLGTNQNVIIENQLTQTDHDHLGKLLTYAAGYNASTVIWVADVVRDEHKQTLEWLNERTYENTQFFGVVVEVFKVDDSKPAFTFTPIVSPSNWQKSKKKQVSDSVSPKGEAYRQYFQLLIDELREKHHFTNAKLGQPQNWYSFPSGYSGIYLSAVFSQGSKARTELYIDVGDRDKNKEIFDWLQQQTNSIQDDLSYTVDWERLEERRACRIAVYRSGTIQSLPEELEIIRAWHIQNLLAFKKVFSPLLKQKLDLVFGR